MKSKLLLMGMGLLMMAACSSEQMAGEWPSGHSSDGITVKLSASGGGFELTEGGTRAADGLYTASTGFSGGETVKVYLEGSAGNASADYSVGAPTAGVSELAIASGDDDDRLLYPATGNTTLYAVYPSTSTATHTVLKDQKTDANYKASDLMYAPAISVTPAQRTETQNLAFQHKLVKLKVVINKTVEVSQLKGITLRNVKRKASVTVSNAGMTVGEAAADGDNLILVSGQEAATNNAAATYTYACVFPAQAWADADFLTVEADTKTTTYKLTKTFVAGKDYQLTITLNGLALGNTVTIDNWNTGDGTICTVNPTAPGGGTLKISDIADMTYTGSALTPATAPTVKNTEGATLTSGTDYSLQYFSNVNAGQAIVLVEGMGDYAGQIGFGSFNILKAAGTISYATASVSKKYGDADFINALTFSPSTGTGLGTATFASSDATVATVNETTGLVHILKPGTTTITATVEDGVNYSYATKTATYALTVGKGEGYVTLSAASGSVDIDGTGTFTVATSHGGTLSVASSDVSKATAAISGTTVTVTGVAAGSATITVTCAANDYYTEATTTYAATVESGKWVDIGLSVLWGKTNLGAPNPGDYGLFYAWGGTTGSTDGNFSTAPTTSPANPTTLPAAYDAATQSSDYSDWRMPTATEMTELINTKSNTTDYSWEWTTMDGNNGWKITSKKSGTSGNWIFLPAAGCRNGTSTSRQGSEGYYWSSSINTGSTSNAQGLHFTSSVSQVYVSSYDRKYGFTVRAVKNK